MLRLVCALLLLGIAGAAAAAELDLQLHTSGPTPTVVVTPEKALTSLRLTVPRPDGAPHTVERKAIAAGHAEELPLPAWPGRHGASFEARLQDGSQRRFAFNYDYTPAGGAPQIGYARERLDLEGHRLEFTLDRPAAHAELRVTASDGSTLATASADYQGESPGTWLAIGWQPSSTASVFALDLTVRAKDGRGASLHLVPWNVHIPHEEVIFASGKTEIRPSETPKLEASYAKLHDLLEEVQRRDRRLPVRLFIIGHTDTVGGSDENRQLSRDRALALAAWFRRRGLSLPIDYSGLGEEALKVKTPDQTDEAQNRRADYILGVAPPPAPKGVGQKWQTLK